jgi:glycerophosphoryl diester phosphodiesterase
MAAAEIPELIAHRGWASRYPENTLESLEGALDAGARFVEFDVQLSADDVPVLMHDATLDRTCETGGCVHDLPWSTLAITGAGEPRRFGGAFEASRIPSLEQALECLLIRPDRKAFVEIKTESLQRFGISRVLDHCLPPIRQAAPDRCIVTSYSDQLLESVRQNCDLPVAWVLTACNEPSLERARRMAPDYLFCNVTKLPDEGVLPPGPWQWAIYEITEPPVALDLCRRGADFIETMAIGEMLAHPQLKAAGSVD